MCEFIRTRPLWRRLNLHINLSLFNTKLFYKKSIPLFSIQYLRNLHFSVLCRTERQRKFARSHPHPIMRGFTKRHKIPARNTDAKLYRAHNRSPISRAVIQIRESCSTEACVSNKGRSGYRKKADKHYKGWIFVYRRLRLWSRGQVSCEARFSFHRRF